MVDKLNEQVDRARTEAIKLYKKGGKKQGDYLIIEEVRILGQRDEEKKSKMGCSTIKI